MQIIGHWVVGVLLLLNGVTTFVKLGKVWFRDVTDKGRPAPLGKANERLGALPFDNIMCIFAFFLVFSSDIAF